MPSIWATIWPSSMVVLTSPSTPNAVTSSDRNPATTVAISSGSAVSTGAPSSPVLGGRESRRGLSHARPGPPDACRSRRSRRCRHRALPALPPLDSPDAVAAPFASPPLPVLDLGRRVLLRRRSSFERGAFGRMRARTRASPRGRPKSPTFGSSRISNSASSSSTPSWSSRVSFASSIVLLVVSTHSMGFSLVIVFRRDHTDGAPHLRRLLLPLRRSGRSGKAGSAAVARAGRAGPTAPRGLATVRGLLLGSLAPSARAGFLGRSSDFLAAPSDFFAEPLAGPG